MRKIGWIVIGIVIVVLLFLVMFVWSLPGSVWTGCSKDLNICPDGSSVGRNPNLNCEFDPCSNDGLRNYISRSVEECKTIQVLCVEGFERFDDRAGCGCEAIKTICDPSQRSDGACIEIYQPVCGWNGPEINCLVWPCASTYSNSCFACQNENVDFWTEDECPSP